MVFLNRHSTSTNLLESLNNWTISISNHHSVSIAYIDFKSAFDCISHPKLLLKLTSYGIKGNLYFWIAAFLSNRNQKVEINSTFSTLCHASSGVPQGSVLGPLLFNLFMNDVTDQLDVSTTTKLFADDIKLYSNFSNVSPSNLQSQLNLIEIWASIWQLRISYSKCNVLIIGSASSETFSLNSNKLTQADNVMDLDVNIDNKLKFADHINSIITESQPTANH